MKTRDDIADCRPPDLCQTTFQVYHQRFLDLIEEAEEQLTQREFASLMDIVARRAEKELGEETPVA